jgi:hypothetical protein
VCVARCSFNCRSNSFLCDVRAMRRSVKARLFFVTVSSLFSVVYCHCVLHACMLFGANIDQNLDIILYIWISCHQSSYLAFEQQLNIHS